MALSGAEKQARYRAKHPEKVREQNRGRRGAKADWHRENRARRLVEMAAYREEHRDALKDGQDAYRVRNRMVLRVKNKAYRDASRDKFLASMATSRAKKIDLYRKKNRKNYRAHPEPYKQRAHERRARVLAAEGTFSGEQVRRMLEDQDCKCKACGDDISDAYHEDHVIPLSRGGSNWITNIQLLCPPCNLSKGDKLPHEWAGRRDRSNVVR